MGLPYAESVLNPEKGQRFQGAGLHTAPTPARPASGRKARSAPATHPPALPAPAGRERVALCRQGCSRRGASLPCLPPAGERWAAPAASRGRVLALRAAGRTNPLTLPLRWNLTRSAPSRPIWRFLSGSRADLLPATKTRREPLRLFSSRAGRQGGGGAAFPALSAGRQRAQRGVSK